MLQEVVVKLGLLLFLISLTFGLLNKDNDVKTIKPIITPSCPQNQHWEQCNGHCGKSCTNKGEINCPNICVGGCVCDEGYVWGPEGDCILQAQCFKSPNTDLSFANKKSDDFCPPNEKFSRCNAHCQHNCSNWNDRRVPCMKICVPGCICENGMVRGPHGNCIRPRQCPPMDSSNEFVQGEYDCPVDEHFVKCRAHCQPSCKNYDRHFICPPICISGCVCDKGYVRGLDGKCVTVDKCIPECPENSHYERCHSNCLPNCLNYNRRIDPIICPTICIPACVCNKGYILGRNKTCVTPDECALHCPEHSHYDRCHALCQRRCSNYDKPFICPPICIEGCLCDEGYALAPDHKCIPINKCPKKSEMGDEKESFDSCPLYEHKSKYQSVYNSTYFCITDFDFFDYCPATFLKGCECDKGLVRGPENKCIDTRLLSNVNELHFMLESDDESKNETAHDIVYRNKYPNSYVESEVEDSYSATHLETNKTEIFSLVNETLDMEGNLVEEHHNEFRTTRCKNLDLEMPNNRCLDVKCCAEFCRNIDYMAGACIGRNKDRCICFD